MIIRKANAADIPALLRLLSQVLEVHHEKRPDIFKSGSVKYTKSQLLPILESERTPVFVADEGGEVLGYCFCIFKEEKDSNIFVDKKTLYIDDLCVDSAHRHKHIGKSLYDYALELARREGCHDLTLNVWAQNTDAVRFYEGLGLTPQKIGMEIIL